MARKDVDLVIRAKDEAEKVVQSITKALNDFNEAQKGTADSSGKTDSALGKLGAAFASLQKAVGGASVGAKIAEEMSRAEAAVSRLETATGKTKEELAAMKTEAAAAETSLAKLTAQSEAQAKAQADQTAAVKKSKADLAALKLEINTLEQATKGLVSEQTRLPETIAKQEAAIAKTKAKLVELQAAYAAAEKPGKTLANQIATTTTRIGEQEAKLATLKTALVEVGSKIATAGEGMGKLAQKATAAEASLAGQVTELASIKKTYSDTTAAAKAAAAAQINTTNSVERLTAKLANEETQLETAKVGFTELSKAAGLSNEQLTKLQGEGVSRLECSLAKQQSVLAGAKEQYLSLSQAAAKLEAEIGRVGVPTRKMSEDFAILKAQVAGSEAILNAARASFLEMASAFHNGEKDLAGLEAVEKAFVASQGRVSAAIQKTTVDYERNLAAIKALHTEQAKGTGSRGPSAVPVVPAAPPVGPWNQLSEAFNRLYGDSRKSLSLTQRLRGEVLSLIAAYGGFYGVVNLLGQVLGAYQKLEASQARLNVANNGDIAKSADDLDFLRRTADRLGVDLGTLAEEYSKFSIATQGTNLAGEKTRKIFLSVAEAARVNRSSTEEISGVFVALTQIVSKGAVQMEELRQQLGDRLPGALQIMADGLGITTAELTKMMQQGQITSDALVPFAEELDRRFGPGLGEALAGTTVALGRLKNAAFQALVGFGKGGFIDAFTELANKLSKLLQSADFKTFIENISKAMATLIEVLTTVVGNFRTFVTVLSAFAGLKLAPLLVGIAVGFKEITVATKAAITTQVAVRTAMGATGAVAATAAVGMTALRAALTALLSSTGVGLVITAVAAGIGYWAASADQATTALERHKEILDIVKNGYDATKGSADEWRKTVEGLTVTEAKANLLALRKAATEAGDAFQKIAIRGDFSGNFFTGRGDVLRQWQTEVDKLRDDFIGGQIDSKKFLAGIDGIIQKFDNGTESARYYGDKVIESAKDLIRFQDAASQAGDIVTSLTDKTEAGQKAFDRASGSAVKFGEVTNDAWETAKKGLADSVAAMEEASSKGNNSIEDLAKLADDLEVHYRDVMAQVNLIPDALLRAVAAQEALNEKAAGLKTIYEANQALIDQGFSGSLVDRIINVESGGNPSAANPNSSAQGLGQFIESTWLRMFKQYFPDRAQGMTDAAVLALRQDADLNRQMVALYLSENAKNLQAAGVAITDANLYLSHFLGPGGAIALLKSAPGTKANDVLSAGQVSANTSILDGKTREEIIAWAQRKVGISKEELTIQETLIAGDQKRAADIEKGAEAAIKAAEERQRATKEAISDAEFEVEQQKLINAGKGQQAALELAIRNAKKANPQITQEEIHQIAKLTAENYKLAHAAEEANKPKEAAQKAEEQVNNLLAQRNALQEQFNIAQQAGDVNGQAALKEQMTAINEQLVAAIDNAEKLWAAVGGTEADAAIAKLEASKMAAKHFNDVAKNAYLDWSKVVGLIVDGLGSAFDSFSQKVADGMKPIQALRESFLQFASDFLIQIAQMIIKQAIFNALQSVFGGTAFGALIGLRHSGGEVTQSRGNLSRRVNPAIFAGAPRYHTGGVIGLKPGEVPIIAKEGERVLTEAEDKALGKALGGAAQATAKGGDTTVINALDSASFLEAALASPAGERVILNWLRANGNAVSNLR